MSNWKREYLNLGIPDLPPEGFHEEVKGHIKPAGGGGGQQPAPTSQTVTQTNIPEYARPYVESLLGRTEALTDINANPYAAYPEERIAGFSPLQQKTFEGAEALGPTAELGAGAGLTGAAGIGALQASGQRFGSPEAQFYMSPYMQNVVDVEKREAQRMADIATQQRGAQAVGAGAFGGSRQAILDAEAARNLAQQQGDIQTRGLQSAFGQAQQQFNADESRRLQGLGVAGQAGAQLGSLGQERFAQQRGALEVQSTLGGQQQQQEQARLSQQYQDFLNQQNYPYRQLGFMSDMLRGLPLSQQQSMVYQAPPNPLSQVAGLGLSAYGLGQLFQGQGRAKGGAIRTRKRKSGLNAAALAKIKQGASA